MYLLRIIWHTVNIFHRKSLDATCKAMQKVASQNLVSTGLLLLYPELSPLNAVHTIWTVVRKDKNEKQGDQRFVRVINFVNQVQIFLVFDSTVQRESLFLKPT